MNSHTKIQRLSTPAMWSSWRTKLKDRFHHRYCREYWQHCFDVDRMSRPDLLELQQRRLVALIDHAVQYVPFYREWAKSNGYRVGDSVSIGDLPIVEKTHFRNDPEAFQSEAFARKDMKSASTSGNTGKIFHLRTHRLSTDYSYCCLARALLRHGIHFGDRRIYFWGTKWHYLPWRRALLTRAQQVCRDWLNVTKSFNAFDLTESNIRRVARCIEAYRPVYLHGWVTALYCVARQILDEGRSLPPNTLKAVVTDAEKLFDFQRPIIERAFNCPIIENYGSVEYGNIAQVDPEGLMRVNEDMFVVERHSNGEAVITNLLSHAYPFIRYRLGDLIELSRESPPGLPFATISNIVGRTNDFIQLPGGGCISAGVFAGLLEPHFPFIDRFQVHQTDIDNIILRLQVQSALEDWRKMKILSDIHTAVRRRVNVVINVMDEIQPTSTGKFRWVVSDVRNPLVDKPRELVRELI